jgi:hypothetical protein
MDTVIEQGEKGAQHHQTLSLRVRYIASRKQYEDPKASKSETLGVLKSKVLVFFNLQEGAVEGGTKSYFFAHDGVVQTDPSLTLGTLAEGKKDLKLDLIERFEQG